VSHGKIYSKDEGARKAKEYKRLLDELNKNEGKRESVCFMGNLNL